MLATVANPAIAASAGPIVAAGAPFAEEDLLLLEVRVGREVLTEALGAYSSRAGVYLPLGELARLLDFAIVVDPPGHAADGWFLDPERTFSLDLDDQVVLAGGQSHRLAPAEAVQFRDEIYLRIDLLGKLLPLTAEANRGESTLQLTPREPLPFQRRIERERRRDSLQSPDEVGEAALLVAAPYELASAPAFDLNVGLGVSSDDPSRATRWDARLAGDVAYTGVQAFVASDDRGSPDSARVLFERRGFARDGSAAATGPRLSAGDAYTPALGIGIASRGGRGFAFTSAPEQQASVFDAIDLRGELPTGYEVELYVNEILRGSMPGPIQGQYEFTGVPLSLGLNVIRLAFFGPRGERYDTVRRINVGGGQLARGESQLSFGAVDQGVPMLELRPSAVDPVLLDPGHGQLSYSALWTHGLSDRLTVRAGAGRYTPVVESTRNLFSVGLAAALGPLATQFDFAADDGIGRAGSVGLSGRLGAVPFTLRHSEYQGGFIDELSGTAVDQDDPLVRFTDVRLDLAAPMPAAGRPLPISLSLRRDEREAALSWTAAMQSSTAAGRVALSSGLAYSRVERPGANLQESLQGAFDASTIFSAQWQVRANVAFDVVPLARIVSTGFTADRNLTQRTAFRLGVQQDWIADRYTSLTGGLTWRLPFLDVSAVANYVSGLDLWSAGVQFSMGALFDPLRGRYRGVRPGATTTGALALAAFIDANGDGRRQPGEAPLAGLRAQGGDFDRPADSQGNLLVTGLADDGRALVGLDLQSLEDPYLVPPARQVEVTPRPGRVATVPFALSTRGDVAVRFMLAAVDGADRGLAAVDAELLDARGSVVARGRSEYDGTVLFESLAPGTYQLRLEPSQSARLGLRLARPTQVTIAPAGGYSGSVDAAVEVVH